MRNLIALSSVLSFALLVACGDKDSATDTAPVDADGDGWFAADDCDDGDAGVNPDATELCDGVDNDCDGGIDDDDPEGPADPIAGYLDNDGDGYGSEPVTACDVIDTPGDCDDDDLTISPDVQELCDGVDNDCDGLIDWNPQDGSDWYWDGDGDGYGDPDSETNACEAPNGFIDVGDDCDDDNADTYPGAEEVCDGADNDCDAATPIDPDDSLDVPTWYTDYDSDGYGDPTTGVVGCEGPPNSVSNGDDCDDDEYDAAPNALEVCDDIDNDCDGLIDDDDPSLEIATTSTWYRDGDNDGYGDADVTTSTCDPGPGYVGDDTDCDDGSALVNPGAMEVCDIRSTDEDCDGVRNDNDDSTDPSSMTTWFADDDYDGFGDDDDTVLSCDQPSGYTSLGGDCDDEDASEGRATAWYPDEDGDGFGDEDNSVTSCEQPTDYVSTGGDCDDTDADINRFAEDIPFDGIDSDCDGLDSVIAVDDVGVALSGVNSSDYTGRSVAGAGDVNGDGYDDLLIGAYGNDNGGSTSGMSSLVLGPVTGDLGLVLADASYTGENSSDYSGWDVAGAGDVNNDGYDDLLIGAYGNDYAGSASGATYLVYGSLTPASIDLSAADARLTGESSSDYSGYAIAGAGDVNDDGYDDVLIGAYRDDDAGSDAGAAYLLLGPVTGSGSLLTADAKHVGEGYSDYAGHNVAGAGDTDGDGFDDILIGAYYEDAGASNAGATYLVLGPATASGSLSGADAKLTGMSTSDYSGFSVDGAGDVSGDGYDDIIIGAWGEDSGGSAAGAAYLVLGPVSGTTGLRFADATLFGETASDYAGYAVAGAGDVDGDGYGEILVGAYQDDDGGGSAGAAYLAFGPFTGELSLADADAKFIGAASNDDVGIALDGAGDLDGDGLQDLLIGAWGVDVGRNSSAGSAYLITAADMGLE